MSEETFLRASSERLDLWGEHLQEMARRACRTVPQREDELRQEIARLHRVRRRLRRSLRSSLVRALDGRSLLRGDRKHLVQELDAFRERAARVHEAVRG